MWLSFLQHKRFKVLTLCIDILDKALHKQLVARRVTKANSACF